MAIGYALGRLRAVRNQCDYDDVVPQLLSLTTWAVARARQIIADLARL
jgi:hypothetical protein